MQAANDIFGKPQPQVRREGFCLHITFKLSQIVDARFLIALQGMINLKATFPVAQIGKGKSSLFHILIRKTIEQVAVLSCMSQFERLNKVDRSGGVCRFQSNLPKVARENSPAISVGKKSCLAVNLGEKCDSVTITSDESDFYRVTNGNISGSAVLLFDLILLRHDFF